MRSLRRTQRTHGYVRRALFLPYFSGERLPRPQASSSAGWQGLGLSTTRAMLAASAVEGMIFGLRRVISALPSTAGVVDLVGGGSRDPLVQQLVADVLGRSVSRRSAENATAIGAALLAWESLGVTDAAAGAQRSVVRRPRERGAVEEHYARFIDATNSLD